MLLGTLGASLLGNMLAFKWVNRAEDGSKGTELITTDYGSSIKKEFLIPPYPLANFKMQKHYQNEPRTNRDSSRDNLHDQIKDGAYVANLED